MRSGLVITILCLGAPTAATRGGQATFGLRAASLAVLSATILAPHLAYGLWRTRVGAVY